jgi:hypothetical protein
MTSRSLWILAFGCLAAAALCAQQGSVAGPLSGYIFDPGTHTLRTIRGVPGAALVGDAVDFGFGLASAYVSPSLDSALVVAADRSLHLFRLNSSSVAERTVEGLSGTVQRAALIERVAFSPSGSALALHTGGTVQVFTGLPDSPVLAGTLEFRAEVTEPQAASFRGPRRMNSGSLAVSDDGAYVLLADSNSVRLLGIAGVNRTLTDAGAGALVAFAAHGHDAAVAGAADDGLVLFRDVAGASERRVPAPGKELAIPAGLAFSLDGRQLFLANSGARSVTAFDLAAGDRSVIACDCAPSALIPMGSVFRLNELGTEPIWLLDAGTTGPRIVFVPAVRPALP